MWQRHSLTFKVVGNVPAVAFTAHVSHAIEYKETWCNYSLVVTDLFLALEAWLDPCFQTLLLFRFFIVQESVSCLPVRC